MQIEKINENQLEVILNLDDLKQNDISIHSFMCNSSTSQNLFLSILHFANTEIGFELNNHEIIIEAFCVPSKKSFILVITRVPKEIHLHISKLKYGKFKVNKTFWIKYENLDDFCMFCNSLRNNLQIQSSLYILDDCYFLHIKLNTLKDYLSISALANEFSSKIYNNNFIFNENAELIIGNSAIEMCKKYFV